MLRGAKAAHDAGSAAGYRTGYMAGWRRGVAQSLVLGSITALTQFVVYGAVAFGAARARVWLRDNARAQVTLGKWVGLLLITVAVWTAWQGWQQLWWQWQQQWCWLIATPSWHGQEWLQQSVESISHR